MNRVRTPVLSSAIVVALFASHNVIAADNAAPNDARSAPGTAPVDAGDDTLDSVVVTGSRIARAELESTMPINVLDFDEVKDFGRFTLYDALMLNPAVAPGLGEFNSGGQEYDKGVANVNLREMGNNRSLVLVDGHRWVSGGARTAAVDLNTIPSALIDRVETVTGGAAAIYGADAVTGAVNVVMKKRMEGTSLSATSGISEESDANQTNFSLATGFDIGESSHLVVGANYTYTDPVLVIDRYTDRRAYNANPQNTNSSDGIPDNIIIDYNQFYRSNVPTFCIYNGASSCASGVRNGDWYQLVNGQVRNIPKDSYTVMTGGDTGVQDGGDSVGFGIFDNLYLRDKSEKASLYSNLEMKLGDTMTWNTTFGYAHSDVSGAAQWPEYRDDSRPTNWWGKDPETGVAFPGGVATLDDPYLPASLRAFMAERGLTQIRLNRHYYNLPAPREMHDRNAFSFGTELTGALTDRLEWSGFVRSGWVNDDILTTNMVGRREWLYARDAVLDGGGNIVCADAAARAAGCAPFNLYSTDAPSKAWQDYALYERNEKTRNRLLNAGLGINGSLFSLPAGDVRVAAGVEWREDKLSTRDDPDTEKLANIVFSPGNDHAMHPALDASRKVSEVFTELVVPVLGDLPGVYRLDIEGAYRYSDYSDNPSTDTWKYGVIWSPIRGLSLRGVKSFSTRVPNFGELYSPIGMVTLGHISDPCQETLITQDKDRAANCAATIPGWTGPLPRPNLNAPVVYSGGNPDLTPETSDSFSYGLVWQPTFLRGLDVTADYWEIEIEDVITSLSYTTIMNNCVNASGGPDMGYCQYVHRFNETSGSHQLGEIDYVQAQYANLAGRLTRGIDFSAHYGFDVGPGRARLGFSGTRRLEQRVIAERGSAGTDYTGAWDYPDFRGTLTLGYDMGQFTIGWNTSYISKSRFSATDQSDETREMPYVPAYYKHDLNVAWRPADKYTVSLGVKNVTSAKVDHPVLAQNTGTSPHQVEGNGSANAYFDAIGRYYFATLKVDF